MGIRIGLTSTFISYESLDIDGDSRKEKKFLVGGRPALIIAGALFFLIVSFGVRTFAEDFTQWQLYILTCAILVIATSLTIISMWLFSRRASRLILEMV